MRAGRRIAPLMGLLVAFSLVLSACGPNQPAAPAGSDNSPVAPVAQGDRKPVVGGELTLVLEKDPDILNPTTFTTVYAGELVTQLYATLFAFDENLEPTPYVAESWKASEDNLTLLIKLKEGVKFSDGTDLDAEDVAFTLGAIMDPGYTGPRAGALADVERIDVVDPYNLDIRLKRPYAPILSSINHGILSKQAFEGIAVADMDKAPASMDKPVGAGPYTLKEYVRGQYVILERNPNWVLSQQHGGAPFIETLTYKIIPDSQTAMAALQAGEIDRLTPKAADIAMLQAEFAGKLTAYEWDRNGFGFMVLNNTRAPLNDKRVRQALLLGLDRDAIISGVLEGRGSVPPGPIPPVSWAFDPSAQALPRDVAKAKALLEEAGYAMNADTGIYQKDGKPLKLTYYAGAGSATTEAVATIARASWKEIGVDLAVQLLDMNAMFDNYVKPGKFDVIFTSFTLGLDPDTLVGLFHSSAGQTDANGNVHGFNLGRFYNEQADQLLERARAEFDLAKRKEYYAGFQQVFMDEAPVIMVYANRYTDFVNSRVKGVVNYPGVGASSEFIYRWYLNER